MPPYECSSQVELRNLLHEPVAQQALGAFAKKLNMQHLLMCWIDIEEYKSVGSFEHRRLCGLKIVYNYVDKTSPLRVPTPGLDPQQHTQSLLATLVPMQGPGPEMAHSLRQEKDSDNGNGSHMSVSSRLDRALFDPVCHRALLCPNSFNLMSFGCVLLRCKRRASWRYTRSSLSPSRRKRTTWT